MYLFNKGKNGTTEFEGNQKNNSVNIKLHDFRFVFNQREYNTEDDHTLFVEDDIHIFIGNQERRMTVDEMNMNTSFPGTIGTTSSIATGAHAHGAGGINGMSGKSRLQRSSVSTMVDGDTGASGEHQSSHDNGGINSKKSFVKDSFVTNWAKETFILALHLLPLNSNDKNNKNDFNCGKTLTNNSRFKRFDIIALNVSSMTYRDTCPDVDAICQNSQPFACYGGNCNDELGKSICSVGYTGTPCDTQDTTASEVVTLGDLATWYISGTKGSTGNYGYCRVNEFTSDISGCNGNWYFSSSPHSHVVTYFGTCDAIQASTHSGDTIKTTNNNTNVLIHQQLIQLQIIHKQTQHHHLQMDQL